MQKSAHTDKNGRQGHHERPEPHSDKGPKYEPFFVGHVGATRNASAHLRRFDQKR